MSIALQTLMLRAEINVTRLSLPFRRAGNTIGKFAANRFFMARHPLLSAKEALARINAGVSEKLQVRYAYLCSKKIDATEHIPASLTYKMRGILDSPNLTSQEAKDILARASSQYRICEL